ncbi:hypothetical protein KC842_03025 [Candidatus Nomurabacteria bacterium]|nr:hypothetical protein [Candidatus Nomurabacteria bacterium]
MINLLPAQQRQKVTKLYHKRVVNMSMRMFSVVVLFGGLFLTPVFIDVFMRLKYEKNILESLASSPQALSDEILATNINRTNYLLSRFHEDYGLEITEIIIKPILSVKDDSVKINEMFFSRMTSPEATVYGSGEIRGLASTREELLDFSNEIEAIKGFDNVVVPVSQFVKGQDIEYSITFDISLEEFGVVEKPKEDIPEDVSDNNQDEEI